MIINNNKNGGIVTDSLSSVAACITQPAQPLPMIHYGMNGRRLFTHLSPTNLAPVVDYGHFTRPGSATTLPPKLRPPPSLDGTATQSTDGDTANRGTSPTPSQTGNDVDDSDDEKIRAVMSAIRPMHPAYCVSGSREVDDEVTNVVRHGVAHSNSTDVE